MDVTPVVLFLGNLGAGEIIFILLLFILLFGAHKIPDLARSLGRAQREFQKARDEATREVESALKTPAPAPPSPPSEEDRVRRAAKELGIQTEGKTADELRALIAERLKPAP